MTQRTLAIVKPDAVENGAAGKILSRIEAEGFRIVLVASVRHSQLNRARRHGPAR